MKRGVLQQLIAGAFDPGVGNAGQTLMYLLDQSRLTDACLARDNHHLTLPLARAFPAPPQHAELFFAAHKRDQAFGRRSSVDPTTHATGLADSE